MTAASERVVLDQAVYARLLVKHVLQATKHVDMKDGSHKKDMATVSIQDRITGQKHSLVFGRVRISGTVVSQCSIDIGGSKEDALFLDDTTGVIPFLLQRCEYNAQSTDLHSDMREEIEKAMGRRLEVASTSADGLLVGKTIEVLGSINWSMLEDSPWPLPTWIEGHQIIIKNEPMSETQALLETLAVYRFYFPAYNVFKNMT